jgi:hypothetical protein
MSIDPVGRAATFASSAAPATRSNSSSYNAGWEQLTDADWDLLSAAAGKPVGPKAEGFRPGDAPLVPLVGADMITARRNGTVAPGQNFGPEFFQTQLAHQPAEMREQLQRALVYAEQRATAQGGEPNGYLDRLAKRVDFYG